ncbi:retrovirus-related pol polyprotein from transposon TNT 1-94 [Tanacetum coccineum]
MSSMQEDIQCAGSDTRPPMLDRTDFESWQQRIRLYCLGKDNEANIMKSINEGPFHMGTVSDVIAGGTEGAVQQGPVRTRVLNDLSAEEKERYKVDIRATNILLQGIPKDIYSLINYYTDAKDIWENMKMILEGSELTNDDRESQLYDEFEHFRQIKGEAIQGYYVRFTKLINDMRNIKMTMPRMQLNSKFVNNMLPEWSRFITEVKLNRGLKESNFDQLYAYLKQHEVHANENRTMMERFLQPTNDPLALVSNASVQKYPTQSSKSPQSLNEPSLADNFQLDSGKRPSNTRIKATVQVGELVVQDVRGRYNANQSMKTIFRRKQCGGNVVAGNLGGQDATNASPREWLQYWMEKSRCFLQGTRYQLDVDVDRIIPENLIGINVDHVFEANECDAFDSDIDEGPTTHTMFMANLTFKDPICDEARPSYDSNTPCEVAIGYKNPLCLTRAKQVQPALYNGHVLVMSNHARPVVHDSEDTCEIAEITRKRMLLKMQSPLCVEKKVRIAPPDYSKENLLATFAPQRNLTPEQIFWSIDDNDRKKAETSVPKPISALTVYPPNTPVKLVPRVLPTKSQSLKAQLRSKESYLTSDSVKPKVLAPGMYAIDVKPIPHPLKNNRSAHLNYISHLKESSCDFLLHEKNTSLNASGIKSLEAIQRNRILSAKRENKKKVEDHLRSLQVILWYLDQAVQKHMTGNRSKLRFVEKFIGTVRFGNDHFGAIMGYGDYVIGDSVISRVYYAEGLGHNLFSVGQFCDSDLEVAFRKHTCFVRDINGADLLKGSRSSNLYTISIDDIMKSSPICLLSKASKSKSWLWHRRLNHLNFGTINDLARKDLVRGLPRLKFEKDHLCSACQLGKSKKFSHKPKSKNTNMEVLHYLHMMDLYACYTQNRSLIHTRHNKTPYELVHDKKPDLTFLRVFGALCYPTNDSEDLGKFQAKADIGIFVGYAPSRKGYRIYNKRTLNKLVPSATEVIAQVVPPGTSLSTTIAQDAPSTSASASTIDMHHPVRHQGIAEEPTLEDSPITERCSNTKFNMLLENLVRHKSSSGMFNFITKPNHVNSSPQDHLRIWTKDLPLDKPSLAIHYRHHPVSRQRDMLRGSIDFEESFVAQLPTDTRPSVYSLPMLATIKNMINLLVGCQKTDFLNVDLQERSLYHNGLSLFSKDNELQYFYRDVNDGTNVVFLRTTSFLKS